MKSNQERSNGCLPPKKREILAMEQRPVVVAAAAPLANDSHHTENLAWLASVASERCRSRETGSPRFPVSTSTSSSNTSLSAVPLTSLSTVYPTALTQQGGTIQYAQLAPNVQFISSALTGPYAGYISSQIIPTNATSSPVTTGQRPHLDSYTTALFSQGAKGEQQFQIGLSPDMAVSLPNSTLSQYIQLDSTPLTVTSPTAHLPLQLHTHPGVLPHTLTLAPSQVVLQYAEGSAAKKSEGHIKGLLNGELERGVAKQNNAGKAAPTSQSVNNQQHQVHSYEARHILLPADYSQETSGLQTTSLVLVANPHPQPHHRPNIGAEPDHGPNKFHPSLIHSEKGGGICLGKTVSRTSSFTSLPSSDVLKPPGPHTVIQTSHSSEELPASLYSTTQPPIIGYITSAGHQHAVSYHATLPQHLVIPGGQSLLIPVSGASGTTDLDATRSLTAMTATTSPQLATAMPHAYLTTALSKCEMLGSDGHQSTAIVQAQVLPILPANTATTVVASPSPAPAQAPAPAPAPASAPAQASPSPSSSPAVLPPFFMRGSIIQLADGELKRVEDLKTEDFIQSAEISSELKIDSSTVERIDCSPTPNAVVIQFAVGELKAQVCVEVLVEYPFFVFGQGWSSCCPDRTTQLFELSCAKLCVGDVCVSLTLRGLRTDPASGRNGQGLDARLRNSQNNTDMSQKNSQTLLVDPTVRNGQSTNAAGSNTGFLMKTVKTERLEKDRGSRCGDQVKGPGPGLGGPGEAVYVAGSRGTSDMQAVSGNGELMQREQRTDMPPPSTPQLGDTDKPLTGRKRRWSAPERDQTDKANEEPPLTLPKPSFISQEVKISIEGRSNTGS